MYLRHPVDLAVLSNASNMIVLVRVEAVGTVVVTYTGIGCTGLPYVAVGGPMALLDRHAVPACLVLVR